MKACRIFLFGVLVLLAACVRAEEAEPRTIYMIEIDIRNSSFSLDIGKHIRNHFNAIQMEIPVDKEFFDSVQEGQVLTSGFKTASFIMKGSISSIKVKCTRKWTEGGQP